MPAKEIHQGDIGTVLEVTILDDTTVVDISSATTKDFFLEKPSGTVVTKAASFTNSGTDGKLRYVTLSGDLDASGTWKIQVHLVISAGTWKSDVGYFTVHPNLA